MKSKVVSSRDLIRRLLTDNDKGMELDEMRRWAVGLKGMYRLAGASCPIVVDGVMSYDRFEREIQRLTSEGEISMDNGFVIPHAGRFKKIEFLDSD